MGDEGRGTSDKGWGTRDEGLATRDGGRGMRDERRGMTLERRGTRQEGRRTRQKASRRRQREEGRKKRIGNEGGGLGQGMGTRRTGGTSFEIFKNFVMDCKLYSQYVMLTTKKLAVHNAEWTSTVPRVPDRRNNDGCDKTDKRRKF